MSHKASTGVSDPIYDTYLPMTNSEPILTNFKRKPPISGLLPNNAQQINVISTKPIVSDRQMSIIAEPVSMSWHNIDVYSQPSHGLSLTCIKKKQKQPVHILKNVSGQVNSGQLLAIMGASGAGKTTLMNVLTQRNLTKLEVKGSVKLNDETANVKTITGLSAYVQQDDLFIANLTVREHLKFHSRVCMDQSTPEQTRNDRVEQVLQDLGLAKCANTRIGKPADVKGISGGEKKRLAFASELLTNPSIMFCDEPTSGLDSFMAMSVVEVLKDMALAGRTIVCTIHQPSSDVFSIFDQLLLMADGRVAYMGKLDQAVEYFTSLGLHCPNNYNPADFYIQKLAIVPGNEVKSKENIKIICDRYVDSPFAREFMPQQSSGEVYSKIVEPHNQSVYKADWLVQFWALLWRSSLSSLREPMVTRIRISQTVFVALLLGAIYWRIELDQSGVMNINGALFLLLTNLNYQNAFGVINTFCVELPIFLREHNNNMYSVSSYFLSKMLAELPTFLMIPIIFVSIYYWMVGLNSGITQFFVCLLICVLMTTSACSFGYLISCVSSTVTMALALGPPIMVPMFIFGGFFLNNGSVPVYFIWLKYISWFYYANEALSINQWQNIEHISCQSVNATQTNGTFASCIPNGRAVIKLLNFNENNLITDMCALLALTIGLRLLAYSALLLRSRKR